MKLVLLLVFSALLGVDGMPFLSTGKKKHNKLLLISFDGFRWNYDEDVYTPNMDQLVQEGVKAKYITPPMITMTSPSHFTTITGEKSNNYKQQCKTYKMVLDSCDYIVLALKKKVSSKSTIKIDSTIYKLRYKAFHQKSGDNGREYLCNHNFYSYCL